MIELNIAKMKDVVVKYVDIYNFYTFIPILTII